MEPKVYELMNEREGFFWWHVGMQKIIDAQLKQYAPKRDDCVILEAGCGTGGTLGMLSRYGRVYGVDVSPIAVEYAKAKNIAEEIALGSVTELPFKDGIFDMVVCLDVLYHASIGIITDAYSEFWRVLKPGGILIVREPAYDWLRGHQDAVVWTKKRYTKKELVMQLEKTGFGLEKATYVNSFLLPLAVIKRFSEHWYKENNVAKSTFYANPILNAIFKYVLFVEAKLVSYINFPFGLSVLCIASKK